MNAMKTIGTRFGIALVASILLWTGTALGQAAQQPPVHQGSTPRSVEGLVLKIDKRAGKVTIRSNDGSIHEFTASKATLDDLKEGDRIEARLRQ
jgi:Cu/Ag efflux protein CusF